MWSFESENMGMWEMLEATWTAQEALKLRWNMLELRMICPPPPTGIAAAAPDGKPPRVAKYDGLTNNDGDLPQKCTKKT
jgi:hypothetical protein